MILNLFFHTKLIPISQGEHDQKTLSEETTVKEMKWSIASEKFIPPHKLRLMQKDGNRVSYFFF